MFAQNEPLKIISLPKVGPEDGQVLVKLIRAGICGAQRNEILGIKGPDKFLPHMMGHEGFGLVEEVGKNVSKVKIGDYVVLHWRKGSGCECFGARYPWANYVVGSGSVTTFSEYSIVAENRITPIKFDPEFLDIYPLLGCALSTSYGIVKNQISNNYKSKVFIAGAGGIGLALGFWLKIFGFESVTIFDRNIDKKKLSDAFGLNFCSESDVEELFKNDLRFGVCLDTTGGVNVISKCFDLLDKNGKLILVGQPKVGEQVVINNALKFFDGVTIMASDGGDFNPDSDIPEMVELLRPHLQAAKTLVTDIISLGEINAALNKIASGSAGRILVSF